MNRCYQTHEFGNTGCAELTALVTDPQGLPVAAAFVYLHGPLKAGDPATLGSGYGRTDSAGTYRLRTIRYAGEPPADGPDTVSVWVVASASPAPGGPIGTVGPTDSALATLEFRPVGDLPMVAEVATIAVPISE